jgi:hypothetical protein
MSDSSRYGASFADVYDDWYGDRPFEELAAFVSQRCGARREVLELGVGTGLMAEALTNHSMRVVGMDASAAMLEKLTEKPHLSAVTALLGDVSDPAQYPQAKFGAILAVFNLLANLTGDGAPQRCFTAVADHLSSDGVFVVESFVPAPLLERERSLETRSVDNDRVVLIASEADPQTRIVHGAHLEFSADGSVFRPWQVRLISIEELDALATTAGLHLIERFEDVSLTPFVDGESTHHLSVYAARRGIR